MVVRVRSSPFRTLTNGNPDLSTLTSDIPLGYLNSHKRNPELSTLTSDILFPGTNSHIRKSELRTLTFDIPSGASTLVAPLRRGPSAAGIFDNLACTTIINSISYLRLHHVFITEAPVRGGVGNPPGLTVSVDPGHTGPRVSPDPGPTPGTADSE